MESSDVSKNLSSVVIGAGVRVREVKPAKFLSEDAVPTSFKMTNSSYTALPLREKKGFESYHCRIYDDNHS